MSGNSHTPAEWEAAKSHVDEVKESYVSLMGNPGVSVGLALAHVIEPLLRRYNGGERTDELYGAMMAVE